MGDFLIKLFGPDWYKRFWIYLGISFVIDVLIYSLTPDIDWAFLCMIAYLGGIILIITIYFLWLVYKRITPKIIQSILSKSLSKIKLLMPFDENGQIQQPGCWLWGIIFLIQILATIVWFFY